MRCEDCHPLLRPYVDAEVSVAERLAVVWHLRQCADCRKRAEGIRAVATGLRALDAPVEAPVRRPRRARALSLGRLVAEVVIAVALGFSAYFLTGAALQARSAASAGVGQMRNLSVIPEPGRPYPPVGIRDEQLLW